MPGVKGKSGVYNRTEWHKEKLRGRVPANFKGDEASHSAVHKWVYCRLERPAKCVKCGGGGRIEWASISREAKRDLNDYMALCVKCHRKYDNWVYKMLKSKNRNRCPQRNNTSGYKGVAWERVKQKWKAFIQVDGKKKNLGRYKNIEDANNARRLAEKKYGYG